MNEIPLLNEMHDWVAYDVAHFAIGRALGVFEKGWHDYDHGPIFYTDNVLSNSLDKIASQLVRVGYLEHDEKRQTYRLAKGFDVEVAADRAVEY